MEADWEVCNEAGFIYKRRRLYLPPSPSPILHHLSEEVRPHGRPRRIAALSKIRDRYRLEVALWDHVADACSSMTEKAKREKEARGSSSDLSSPPGKEASSIGRPGMSSLVDRLLLQVERREAIVCNLTKLCDRAEALCDAHEESFRDSLLHLPVWASPQELMTALCDE